MRTLYLHIGTHRTATSSTQAFLHANTAALRRSGVLYPFGVKRHFSLMNAIFSDRRTMADVTEDLHKRSEGSRHDIRSVILSDEDICMRRDLSRLADFRSRFEVKVVFALRRQDLWLESWYLQNVKWQWNPSICHATLDEFIERRAEFFWADYRTRIDHMEEVFGRENVLLYVFEKEQMPKGPVETFCDMVGITGVENLEPAPHTNPSHSPLVSEFMRCLPLDQAPPHYRSQLERACAALDRRLEKTPAEGSPWLLDPARRAAILDEHNIANAEIARRYFGRDQLFLAPLPAADAPLARMELPSNGYDLMERFIAPFVHELINLNREKP